MFEDGLRYQDARMASEDEMKRDLYGFHINDSRRIPKGGPILFRESDMAYVDPRGTQSYCGRYRLHEDTAFCPPVDLFLCKGRRIHGDCRPEGGAG